MTDYDVGIVGGGIAGAAVACFAARRGLSVVLLEREEAFCGHSTGRSAASLDPSIGPPAVEALTRASLPYLDGDLSEPPDRPTLNPRPVLLIAGADGEARLCQLADSVLGTRPEARMLTSTEATAQCPALRPESVVVALLVPDAYDIDTEMLFERLLVSARLAGAVARRGFEIKTIVRRRIDWALHGPECVTVSTVVNAAGAWADDVAAMADVKTLGLRPLRRTALAVAGPEGSGSWPLVANVPETFYMKPWGRSQLLLSPADETQDEPGDARPRELDVARCIQEVNAVTTLSIRHVRSSWAGHRTFAADRVPVVGFDTDVEGFFWCAALGGSGVQNAPAIAELAGALLAGDDPPAEIASLVEPLSPCRLRTPNAGASSATP